MGDSTQGGRRFDFGLREEQEALRDLARDLALKEVALLAAESEREERPYSEFVKRSYQLALLHYSVPRECARPELGRLEGCLAPEELFSACAGAEVVLCGKIPGLLPLLIPGGPELKRVLRQQHCSDSKLAALCLTRRALIPTPDPYGPSASHPDPIIDRGHEAFHHQWRKPASLPARPILTSFGCLHLAYCIRRGKEKVSGPLRNRNSLVVKEVECRL